MPKACYEVFKVVTKKQAGRVVLNGTYCPEMDNRGFSEENERINRSFFLICSFLEGDDPPSSFRRRPESSGFEKQPSWTPAFAGETQGTKGPRLSQEEGAGGR